MWSFLFCDAEKAKTSKIKEKDLESGTELIKEKVIDIKSQEFNINSFLSVMNTRLDANTLVKYFYIIVTTMILAKMKKWYDI